MEEPAEFARHSEEFLDGWRAKGNDARFMFQPGRNHFTAITDLMTPEAPLSAAIYDLIGRVPRAASPSRIDRRLFAGRDVAWRT